MDMWSETHVRILFQKHMPRKHSETFRLLWDDSGSEDLLTYYKADENVYDYYIQDTTLLHFYTLLFGDFLLSKW